MAESIYTGNKRDKSQKKHFCDWCDREFIGGMIKTYNKEKLCSKCGDEYWNGCSGF